MQESTKSYPFYSEEDKKVLPSTALVTFTYAELLEIANIFYYVNKLRIPRLFGGICFTEPIRVLHHKIHNAAVNCCKSLKAAHDFAEKEKQGR